jgi:hypothetical protein
MGAEPPPHARPNSAMKTLIAVQPEREDSDVENAVKLCRGSKGPRPAAIPQCLIRAHVQRKRN